jgi:endonuclease YncB( thermonuclease family)
VSINGVDANLEQIKAGMAWHYKKYQKDQSIEDRVEYARAEDEARAGKRGLWLDSEPVAPWDFRKASKGK